MSADKEKANSVGHCPLDKFLVEVASDIEAKETVVFCGAGISRNSGLPVVDELLPYILGVLDIARNKAKKIEDSDLPFEALIEALAENSNPRKIFDIYKLGVPNSNHLLLAKLAKAGYLESICTTNFDRLIETAFEREGLERQKDYQVFHREEDFDHINWLDSRTRIIKLHGSVEDHNGMAITLKRVASRVLSRQIKYVLDHIFSKGTHKNVLVLGYSCSDVFDVSPQLKAIKSEHKRVVLVDHHKDKRTISHLSKRKGPNPFKHFRDGTRIEINTNRLVKEIWDQCVCDEYNLSTSSIESGVWHELVKEWLCETETATTTAAKYHIAGHLFENVSEFEDAIECFERAFSIAKSSGDRANEGGTLSSLATLFDSKGETTTAITYYLQALRIFRELGYKNAEGETLAGLGGIHSHTGNIKEAIACQERALAIAKQLGNKKNEGMIYDGLGETYIRLSDYQEAISYQKRALEIARELGNKRSEASVLKQLGVSYRCVCEFRKAIDCYEKSANMALELGDRSLHGAVIANLADVKYLHGDYDDAVGYFEQSLNIAKDTGYKHGEGIAHNGLGNIYSSLGENQKAKDHYEKYLIIARETDDKMGQGNSLLNLGMSFIKLGDVRQAIDCFEQALSIDREIGDRLGIEVSLGNLGIAHNSLGRNQNATDYYEQALEVAREIGDRRGIGIWLANLGHVSDENGEHKGAISYYEEALGIVREIEDKTVEEQLLGKLAILYHTIGDISKTIWYLEQSLQATIHIYGAKHPGAERARRALDEQKAKRTGGSE